MWEINKDGYRKGMSMNNNFDKLYDKFSSMTLVEVKYWLRKYVELGQSRTGEFGNESMTFRALCRCASMALEGTPKDELTDSYVDTKYGSELYWYMVG